MGLWAKYPIALAPGMGENFFFVSVIMTLAAAGVRRAVAGRARHRLRLGRRSF